MDGGRRRERLSQAGWFVFLWLAGVGATGMLAFALRWLTRLAYGG